MNKDLRPPIRIETGGGIHEVNHQNDTRITSSERGRPADPTMKEMQRRAQERLGIDPEAVAANKAEVAAVRHVAEARAAETNANIQTNFEQGTKDQPEETLTKRIKKWLGMAA